MCSQVDVAHIGGKSDHRHDHVGLFGHGSGRIGPGRSLGKHERGFTPVSCVDRDPVMGLLEMLAHGRTHDAGADPAYARLGRNSQCRNGVTEKIRHSLFNQRRDAVRNRLHDPFLIHGDLPAFKA